MAARGATPACIAPFAFFAGLPFSQGLDKLALQTWLAAGGGAMLSDELAAEHGFKPLVAGHTGPSTGVWAAARLETPSDLAGTRLHVEGLSRRSLARSRCQQTALLRRTCGQHSPRPAPRCRMARAAGRGGSRSPTAGAAALPARLQPQRLAAIAQRGKAAVGRHGCRRPGELRGLRGAGESPLPDRRRGARLDCEPGRGPDQVAGPAGMATPAGRGPSTRRRLVWWSALRRPTRHRAASTTAIRPPPHAGEPATT